MITLTVECIIYFLMKLNKHLYYIIKKLTALLLAIGKSLKAAELSFSPVD